MQVPSVTNASTPPLVIVQTPEVDDVKLTVKLELDVAVSVGVVPKLFVPGSAKVIDCEPKPVTDPDAPEALPVPALLVAATVNVYAVPLVRPVTTIGLDEPEALCPPVFDVTVYEVIDAPPVEAGAVNATDACSLLAVAVPIVGAPGTTAETVKDLLTRVAAL